MEVLTAAPPWSPARIRALRKRLRWSQAELADALGFARAGTVTDMEAGKYNPGPSTRVLLELIEQHDGLPSKRS